jgi:hypothetical protein
MKKILPLILMFIFSLVSYGQIDCEPTIGFVFKPIKQGISLYTKPDLNSKVALKSPSPDDIWLSCTNVKIINDFVEVEVRFIHNAFRENGVNLSLLDLYQYLTNEYKYSFNFQEFAKFIMIEENQKNIYDLLLNDENNDWFKDYSSSKEYDMSTFEGFYKYWIKYDKTKSNDDYIFDNQGKIFYVHKSEITNKRNANFILIGANSDYYLKYFNEQLELKSENSCIFTEYKLMSYFEFYSNALIKEDKPFKVIQEINKFSYQFKNFESLNTLNFLKMKASYFDSNYTATINLAKKLINLYDTFGVGDIDMSRVYAFIISSLVQTDKNTEALKYSKKCDLNSKLQFEQHIEFYTISLLNLEQKTEACNRLNKAYLDGNEGARELIKKYCE